VILRLAAPPAFLALLATIAFVAAFAAIETNRGLIVNVWLLAMGSLILWFCWRTLASALPTPAASAFDTVRDRPASPPSRLADVIEIESVILDAEWSWAGVEHRLRPLLRRIASSRLVERYQVDMESQPDAARQILGEELWALVGPGPCGPAPATAGAAAPEIQSTADQRTVEQGPSRGDRHRRRQHLRGIPRATIERTIEQLEAL
jgi:hypothetical protein